MKKAAVINDLSGFGKCSLTAAIPVLSALGVQCCPLATAVLTGQTGYPYFHCTDLTDMMPQYIDAWTQNNAHFDAIYSGYMTGRKQIEHLLDLITQFRRDDTLLLVDPVMGDDGRVYGIYSDDLLDGMKELSRKADVITPNLTEACLLSDTDITKATDYTDTDSFLAFAAETAVKVDFPHVFHGYSAISFFAQSASLKIARPTPMRSAAPSSSSASASFAFVTPPLERAS